MYIIKNAFRCIGRSKGRNILIGIIALVIAVSACLGLSIRQAAESAKQSALDELTVTATISYDRSSMMNNMMGGGKGQSEGKFDKDQFSSMMGSASALTLEEYQKYAEAESVQDFNYTLTAYFNGTDTFLHVSDEIEETDSSSDFDSLDGSSQGGMEIPGGRGDKGGMMSSRNTGDFTLIGYSSDNSMTAFMNGTASILEGGTMFEEGTSDYNCVISEELAIYNDLSVGDTIVLTNPSLETEGISIEVCG